MLKQSFQRRETDVKMMFAAAAVTLSAVVFALLVVVELVERLLPVLMVAGVCWIALVMWRRSRRPGTREPAAAAQRAQQPALPPAAAVVDGAASLTAAAQRRYLVTGPDAGFTADRDDGYLRLNPPPMAGPSCSRRPPHPLRHVSRRRPQQRRTTRP